MVGSIDDIREFPVAEGVQAKPFFGEHLMLNHLVFESGAEVPKHDHPHEQLGIVLRGEITMRIDGVDYRLEAGGTYVIPGEVPHSGRAGAEGCTVLDAFYPIREDYRALAT